MKPIQPTFGLGAKGQNVTNLQEALLFLILKVPARFAFPDARAAANFAKKIKVEMATSTFDEGTKEALQLFQKANGLETNGDADKATADLLNALLEELGAFRDAPPAETGSKELSLGMSGARVAEVQTGLGRLGYSIPQNEIAEAVFGAGTQSAIRRFQDAMDLTVTGRADGRTLAALARALAEQGDTVWRVEGRLYHQHGGPAAGVSLRFRQTLFGGETKLLTGQDIKTDEMGWYLATYLPETEPVTLTVLALQPDGKEVALSHPVNAKRREVLTLVAPAAMQPATDAEFNRLSDAVRPHLGARKLAEAREDHERSDLSLLRQSTGWDARLIGLAATADRLSAETRIPPDALYGLLRVGLPMGKEELARVGDVAVEKALVKSRDAGVVSLNDAQIAAAKGAYTQFARETRRAEKAPGALSSLGTFFNKSGLDGVESQKFEDLYFAHRGSPAELWEKARAGGIAEKKIDGLRLQGKMAYLTSNNAELSEKLQQEIGTPDNLGVLVEKDLHRADAWKSRLTEQAGNDETALQKLIPPAYIGAKPADRLEAYTADLARQVRVSFPMKVVGRMIATDELRLGEAHAEVKEPVGAFLRNAEPLGFALGSTPLDAFVAQHQDKVFGGIGEADRASTMQSVQRLQRLYQITPGDESLKTLSALGFSSAHDVTAFSEEKFVQSFGHHFASKDEARLIARKSQQVTTAVYSFFTAAKQLDSTPLVYVLSAPAKEREQAKDALIKQFPTMKTLFGALDYCECEHCRSVLSPAAYLVDLLEFINPAPLVWQPFLDEWRSTHGGKDYDGLEYGYRKPFDVLAERRPDLPHLPLTCENTQTALPYIDVVNEILEYYVAKDQLEAGAARDTGTSTTPELLAEPQNLLPEAYARIEAAHYPLALPFDLWLETVRRFCEHFETPLWRVLETFRTTDQLFAPNPAVAPQPGYFRADVFAEQLGLSPAEVAIFTNPDPLATWHLLYGFDDPAQTAGQNQTDALAALKSAGTLSRRLGVSYKELVELVRCGFVNPQLETLVLLRKLDLEVDDVFRFKGHVSYPAFTADESAAFTARLDAATATFSATGFDAKAWLDAAWVAGRFDRVLLLAGPTAGSDFDKTILRFADGTAADELVFLKLHWLVRLWRKLGWTLAETDRAVQACLPQNSLPLSGANAGPAWQTALIHLSHFRALAAQVAAGRHGRLALLALWSDLPTTGDQPLYARLFLTPGVLKNDAVFDDPLGQYLSPANLAAQAQARQHEASLENVSPADELNPAAFAGQPRVTVAYDPLLRVQRLTYQGVLTDVDKATLAALSPSPALPPLLKAVQARGREFTLIAGHLLALQGSLGLTADEIGRILVDAGLDPATAPLSLGNVSLLHRYVVLARALRFSLPDLLGLKALSGLDPCHPLSADALTALAQDHPFSQTLRFVEIATQIRESGFHVEALDYFLRHRLTDPVGPYRAQAETPLALVKTLAAELRRIRLEHAVPADPASFSDELLGQKLALVLAPEVVATFLGMWAGTVEFAALEENVASGGELAPDDFAGEPAIQVRYDAVNEIQRLTYRGVLLDAGVAPLKAAHPSALFGKLLDQAQAQMKAFFEKHFVLVEPPFLAEGDFDVLFAADSAALTETQQRERRAKLATAFLPFLLQKLAREVVVRTLAASLNTDPAFIAALVNGMDLLSDPAQAGQPLFEAFAAAGSFGLTAAFLDGAGNPLQEVQVATADITALDAAAPAPPAGTNSARFEAWLEAPASGAFRFTARCGKKDAEAELRFAHLPDPVFRGKAAKDDDVIGQVIELQAGLLYRMTFEAHVLGGGGVALLVQGDNQPRQSLDQWSLHPVADIERVRRAFVLLSKTLQLVQGLALNEREMRYLRAHAADFDGLDFSQWPTREADDSAPGAVARFGQFLRLAGYASLKRNLAITDDALIGLFENARLAHPATTDANRAQSALFDDVCKRFGELTRRDLGTVRATATALGFRTESVPAAGELRVAAPDFAQEKGLAQLWEALQLVEKLEIPVSAIVRCTGIVRPSSTAAERFAIARDLRQAVKARFEPETWQRVAQPIFDKLRQRQRDALVAFVLHRLRYERVEQLFEHFLIDPGMEPVVQTSRLRLAISSVQTFIQRCLLNLEPKVHPSAINAQHWEWMKRYRVWEANRKIYLFPENWLEPEFRDDKTHLFQELEGALLQGDVSNDMVEDGFFRYLKQLETIARLEMVTMYAEERPLGSNVLHLIGRTFSSPHKYFYRRYSNQMWTPWEPVDVEIEGDHVAAVIWRERLHLFWLTFMEKAKPPTGESITLDLGMQVSTVVAKEVEIQLNWSDLFQGEWTKREAGGFGNPLRSNVSPIFDRRDVFIHVSKDYEGGEERGVQINLGGALSGAFLVVSKNSPPDPEANRRPAMFLPYSVDYYKYKRTTMIGTGPLRVSFNEKIITENGGTPGFLWGEKKVLRKGGAFSLLSCSNLEAFTDDAAERRSLIRPFFYQDSRHTFFVEPTLTETTIDEWDDWVPAPPTAVKQWNDDDYWKGIQVDKEVPRTEPVPIPKGDPRAIFEVPQKGDWVINPLTAIEYGGSIVGESGRIGTAGQPGAASIFSVELGAAASNGRVNVIGAGGFLNRRSTNVKG